MECEVRKGGLPALCSWRRESAALPWKPAGGNPALQLHGRIYSTELGLGNLNQQSTGKMAHLLAHCLHAL